MPSPVTETVISISPEEKIALRKCLVENPEGGPPCGILIFKLDEGAGDDGTLAIGPLQAVMSVVCYLE